MTTKKQFTTYDLVSISIFAVFIAICSWISIPSVVPFTLQTFGVFLAIGVLGGKRGSVAVFIYILLGAFGLPVFSGFSGGIGYLAGNTGGYIIGFIFSALLMWGIETIFGNSKLTLFLSMLAGLLLCYLIGTLWFFLLYTSNTGTIGLGTVLGLCVIPFIIPDLLKIILAMMLTNRLRKIFQLEISNRKG